MYNVLDAFISKVWPLALIYNKETIKVENKNYNQILSIIYLHILVNVLYILKGLDGDDDMCVVSVQKGYSPGAISIRYRIGGKMGKIIDNLLLLLDIC